jgi:RNA polymerase sigma factor for flagellar operon FliA
LIGAAEFVSNDRNSARLQAAQRRRTAATLISKNRENALGTTADQAPKIERARSARSSLVRVLDEPPPPRRSRKPVAVLEPSLARERVQSDVRDPIALERSWSSYRRRATDAARNRLVEAYQPMLADIVRRFATRLPRSVDRGDLDTAANFGLISAIEGFDPARGVRFESYAELRVKGALLDELRNQDWLSRPWRARFEQHKRVCEKLRTELDGEPNDEEVARGMEMPLGLYRQVFGVGMPGAPLGAMPASRENGEDPLPGLDIVPDTHSDAPGEKLSRDEILRLVAQKLTVQEYRIVYLKYWEELSMREIGELMHLSESRVCKIHTRLLERLKDRFHASGE